MLKVVRNMLIVLLNIILYGLIIFAGVQLCRTGYSFAYETLGDTMKELPPGQEKSAIITSGQDDFSVAKSLEEQGVIKDKYSFFIRLKLEKSEEEQVVVGGPYALNTSMTYEEIIQVIYKNE